jgi:hypothetical protein
MKFVDSWKLAGQSSSKFSNYFEIYDELFGHLRNSACTFIEIGIQGGGSLQAWKNYLGPASRVIGIDVNPACKSLQQPGIEIFIGDAGDLNFLRETFLKIGKVDGILDDGGHQYLQQITVVRAIGMFIKNDCVAAIEDTTTSFYKDFGKNSGKNFLDYVKDLSDFMHLDFFQIYPDRSRVKISRPRETWYSRIASIKFYPGIVGIAFRDEVNQISMVTRGVADNSLYGYKANGVNSGIIPWPNLRRHEEISMTIFNATTPMNTVMQKIVASTQNLFKSRP